MKVQQISVNVRYSKALCPREHKTLELGLEATLDGEDDWGLVQQGLYTALTSQLRVLWGKNGHNLDNGSEEGVTWEQIQSMPSPALESPSIPHYYCEKHRAQLRQYEKGGKTWYSHKAPDGSWCKG